MKSFSSLVLLFAVGLVGANLFTSPSYVAAADCPSGLCRSQWGFCGVGPEYCGSNPTPQTSQASQSSSNGCPAGQCKSQWGYCGSGPDYCGGQAPTQQPSQPSQPTRPMTATPPPPANGGGGQFLSNRNAFNCMFPSASDARYNGMIAAASQMNWNPQNADEVAAFYGHVAQETDSLKTLEEYCGANGSCATAYNNPSWGSARAAPGKTYFGRGWFQLSWPPNYQAAGNDPAIHTDLVAQPELVSADETMAAKTGIWYFTTTAISNPPISHYAAAGWFSASTNKINGPLECNTGAPSQLTRVQHYQDARRCLGLAPETNMQKASCAGPGWQMPGGVNEASDSDAMPDAEESDAPAPRHHHKKQKHHKKHHKQHKPRSHHHNKKVATSSSFAHSQLMKELSELAQELAQVDVNAEEELEAQQSE